MTQAYVSCPWIESRLAFRNEVNARNREDGHEHPARSYDIYPIPEEMIKKRRLSPTAKGYDDLITPVPERAMPQEEDPQHAERTVSVHTRTPPGDPFQAPKARQA